MENCSIGMPVSLSFCHVGASLIDPATVGVVGGFIHVTMLHQMNPVILIYSLFMANVASIIYKLVLLIKAMVLVVNL